MATTSDIVVKDAIATDVVAIDPVDVSVVASDTDTDGTLLRFALTTAAIWKTTNICFEIQSYRPSMENVPDSTKEKWTKITKDIQQLLIHNREHLDVVGTLLSYMDLVYTNSQRLIQSLGSSSLTDIEVAQANRYLDELEKHVAELGEIGQRVKACGNSAFGELVQDASRYMTEMGHNALVNLNTTRSSLSTQITKITDELYTLYDDYYTKQAVVNTLEAEIKYDELLLEHTENELSQIDEAIMLVQTQQKSAMAEGDSEIKRLEAEAQKQQQALQARVASNLQHLESKQREISGMKHKAAQANEEAMKQLTNELRSIK